jgi:hypothetical protein
MLPTALLIAALSAGTLVAAMRFLASARSPPAAYAAAAIAVAAFGVLFLAIGASYVLYHR